jgi:hypothetical protein
MARGPCTFREKDVTRAVNAVRKAGVKIAAVKIDRDGAIEIIANSVESAEVTETESQNEWDRIP